MATTRLLIICVLCSLLCMRDTDAFSVKLNALCELGTWCNYFVNGVKKWVYSAYPDPASDSLCMQTRIEECSCYEMLLLQNSWSPKWPGLDRFDVDRLRMGAVKKYHPDKMSQDYDGDRNAPFIFLEKCCLYLSDPATKKDYTERLQTSLSALPTDPSMDKVARQLTYNINTEFIRSQDSVLRQTGTQDEATGHSGQGAKRAANNVETLYIFLDNTLVEGLDKGKRMLKTMQNRILSTLTNVYLVDGRKPTLIVSPETRLDSGNIDATLYKKWTGVGSKKSGYYLWEQIWFEMVNKKSNDCEIYIFTDGYNAYQTGGSHSNFRGMQGLRELMKRLKENEDQLCRTNVLCLGKECKAEVGKSFLDVAQTETIPTGGYACDDSNWGDCQHIFGLSHEERVKFSLDAKGEHIKEYVAGNVKALPYFDYSILKAKKTDL